jgi:hypothetical protein
MSEDPKLKTGWLVAAFNLLTILEKILPAFLILWSNNLQNKNRELQGRVELEEIKRKELENEYQKPKKSTRRILSDFFTERKSRK